MGRGDVDMGRKGWVTLLDMLFFWRGAFTWSGLSLMGYYYCWLASRTVLLGGWERKGEGGLRPLLILAFIHSFVRSFVPLCSRFLNSGFLI
jgi:hypothetical protein